MTPRSCLICTSRASPPISSSLIVSAFHGPCFNNNEWRLNHCHDCFNLGHYRLVLLPFSFSSNFQATKSNIQLIALPYLCIEGTDLIPTSAYAV